MCDDSVWQQTLLLLILASILYTIILMETSCIEVAFMTKALIEKD